MKKRRDKRKSFKAKVKKAILRREYPLYLRGTTRKNYDEARKKGELPMGKGKDAPSHNLRPSQSWREKNYVKRFQASVYSSVKYALDHVQKPIDSWMFLGQKTPASDLPVLFIFKSPSMFMLKDRFGEKEYFHRGIYEEIPVKGKVRDTLTESEPTRSSDARLETKHELAKFTVTKKEFLEARKKAFEALKKQGFTPKKGKVSWDECLAFMPALREELGKILVNKIVKAVREGKL
jgi:hypothetical protein